MPDEKEQQTPQQAAKKPGSVKRTRKERHTPPGAIPARIEVPTPAQEAFGDDPGSLLRMAIQAGNVAVIDRLAALYKEWQADKAKAAFADALAGFQYDIGQIKRGSRKTFTSEKTGKLVTYNYANLDAIVDQTRETRNRWKLAYRYEYGEVHEGGKVLLVTVTCVLLHGTHEERTKLSGPPDLTGFKNDIQAEGSTVEYLRRYTLAGALGIAISEDLDGERAKTGGADGVLETAIKACKEVQTLHALFNEQESDKRSDPKVIALFKNREKELKK